MDLKLPAAARLYKVKAGIVPCLSPSMGFHSQATWYSSCMLSYPSHQIKLCETGNSLVHECFYHLAYLDLEGAPKISDFKLNFTYVASGKHLARKNSVKDSLNSSLLGGKTFGV